MRPASCGLENLDGMTFLQSSPPVSTASPLPTCAPTPSGYILWHLAVKLLTPPCALEGQRTQIVVHPDAMEEQR